MTPVIQAGAIYHNATPAMLYEFFMDSDKHSAATGMPAKISQWWKESVTRRPSGWR